MSGGAGPWTAEAISRAFQRGEASASEILENCLSTISDRNPAVNAFTDVTVERARAAAAALDRRRRKGEHTGPLAALPFGVKNNIDVAGIPTRAGSKVNRVAPRAQRDATVVARMEAAGAILVGALNMGEFAYDFTGDNDHDGPSRNPHDTSRMSGGSSGGCGAAVGAGLVPLALGTDTNGSVRIPAALCGTFALKPTFGRVPRTGTFPFVASLDHVGPFATSVAGLARSFDAIQGVCKDDPVSVSGSAQDTHGQLDDGLGSLRVAIAGGYYREGGDADALVAVDRVAAALGCSKTVIIPEAARARAAAQLVTAAEGSALHLRRLQEHGPEFGALVRQRLLAGLAIPAAWVDEAHRFRRWFHAQLVACFDEVDVIVAPAAPFAAPPLGVDEVRVGSRLVALRPALGLYTQPLSFAGVPVAAVPVWLDGASLPRGVQIITAPGRELHALRVARELEARGIAQYRRPALAAAN